MFKTPSHRHACSPPFERRVDEGKDEEDSDEPVGVGVYSFSKVETDDDATDDDADDDGK